MDAAGAKTLGKIARSILYLTIWVKYPEGGEFVASFVRRLDP
jgi:hypothetical protein